MREYGKTKSAHWINPRLSGCARIMAAYLFGGAHCNWIGCFNCPPQYAAADTDLPLSRVKKAYAELVAEGLIKQFGKMVFLVNFFQIEKVDNPNTATSRFKELMQLPDGEHRAFVACEMLKHFGQYLKEEYKAQLVAIAKAVNETVSERVSEPLAQPLAKGLAQPLPEPLAEPLGHGYANRDRDRDRDSIYKSKAQQQQLSGPGASAAPLPTPGNGSLAENFPTQPQPAPNAEPANGPQAIAGLLAKATKTITPEGAQPADPLPEPSIPTAQPESHSTVAQTESDSASQPTAIDPERERQRDYARMWGLLNTQQRYVLLNIAGATPEQLEDSAAATWWQFKESGRKKLINAIETLRPPQPDTAPAATSPTPEPEDQSAANTAAKPEAVPADRAVDLKTPQIAPASQAAQPLANPDSDLNALGAPLAPENGPGKGFIHDDPKAAKNDANQTLSENPAQSPLTDAAFLQTTLPQGVEIAIWHNFERMAREKVRWSAGTCFTLTRQLRQAVANGADGNAVLEWATVRSLIDLPDAWQRMQADAAKKKAREPQEEIAAQSQDATGASTTECGRNADAMPTDDATVAEPVNETVSGTVSEPVSEGVTGTDHLTAAVEKPKQNLKKPVKAKKSKTERGHRLPENWQPNDELMQWAEKEYPHVDAFKEVDKFCDYWESKPGKEGRKLNWDKTFKNWIRNANEFTNSRAKPSNTLASKLIPDAGGRLPGESVSDAAMRVYVAKQEKRARGELEEPLKINLGAVVD